MTNCERITTATGCERLGIVEAKTTAHQIFCIIECQTINKIYAFGIYDYLDVVHIKKA